MPKSVPTAKRTGPLAGYSCNPVELTKEITLDGDVWETWDPKLNALISHCISENHPLVTRGKYGLIGLVCFMEHLVRDRKLDEGLLEGKVGRIIDAIDRHRFFIFCHSFILTKLIILVFASHKAYDSRRFPTKSSLSKHPPLPKPSPSKPKHCSHCYLKDPKAPPQPSPPPKRCPHPKRFLLPQSERPSHPNRPSQSDSGERCHWLCPRRHVLHLTRHRLVEKLRREGGDLGVLRASSLLSKS